MNRRGTSIALFGLVGLCAYGLGLLLGGPVSRTLHRPTLERETQVIPNRPRPAGNSEPVPVADSTNQQTSAFLPEPERAFEVFAAKIRELDASGRWDRDTRQLRPLLFALSSNDYPKAWKALKDLHTVSLRDELQRVLMGVWAKCEPRVALAAVLALPEPGAWDKFSQQILWTWGEKEPEAAMAWVRKMPAGERQTAAMDRVLCGVAQTNPALAAQLLAELPSARNVLAPFYAVQKLAVVDSEAAAGLLDRVQDAPWREMCLGIIAGAKAARSIPEAVAWAEALASPKDRAKALEAVVSNLLASNVTQAARFVVAQSDTGMREQLAARFVEQWAYKDVQAAANWTMGLPEGQLRRKALQALNSWWSHHDPEGAAKFVLTTVPAGKDRAAALAEIARSWSFSGDDDEPIQYVGQVPAGADRDAFLSALSSTLNMGGHSEQAARLAASISAPQAQGEALRWVATKWMAEDREAALAWAAGLPAGSARVQMLSALVQNWAADPVGCSQWLQTLPADEARAKAAENYVAQAGSRRPELAAQWVDSITDEAKRNEQTVKIAQQWLKRDPAAAQAWLQQTLLPAEQKQALLGR